MGAITQIAIVLATGIGILFYLQLSSLANRVNEFEKRHADSISAGIDQINKYSAELTKTVEARIDAADERWSGGLGQVEARIRLFLAENSWVEDLNPSDMLLGVKSLEPGYYRAFDLIRQGKTDQVRAWLYGILKEDENTGQVPLEGTPQGFLRASELASTLLGDENLALRLHEFYFSNGGRPRFPFFHRVRRFVPGILVGRRRFYHAALVSRHIVLLCRMGHLEDAAYYLEMLEPRSSFLARTFGPFVHGKDWRAYTARAEFLASHKKYEAALAVIDKAAAATSFPEEKAYLGLARIDIERRAGGDVINAIGHMRVLLEAFPFNLYVYRQLALLLTITTDKEHALEIVDRGIAFGAYDHEQLIPLYWLHEFRRLHGGTIATDQTPVNPIVFDHGPLFH